MRLIGLIIAAFTCFELGAQNQNNTWLFGTYLGMKFNNGIMRPIPDKASPMYATATSAAISDKESGNLLFYTNGKEVYNKANNLMLNGNLAGSLYTQALIVEASNNHYFLFYTNESDIIYYALINLNTQNGLGRVVFKDSILATGMDLQFTAVKLPNNQGHWLITHQKATNRFFSYSIIKNNLNKTPVISTAGPATYPNTQYNYGKMTTNGTGTKLVYGFYSSNPNSLLEARVVEFNIDKKCGTISLKKELVELANVVFATSCNLSYDTSGRYLYVSYSKYFDSFDLYQYDMSLPNPENSKVLLASSYENIGHMQLGPDGKIYLANSVNRTFTSRISVIHKPSLAGTACNFAQNSIELSSNPFLGSIGTEYFPTMVEDIFNFSATNKTPTTKITTSCAQSPSIFELENESDLIYDSVTWDFGDGNSSNQLKNIHTFNDAGTYVIKFIWHACSNKFELIDTIKIIEKTPFSLGTDTTLCHGKSITLFAPNTAQKYSWNTGDTTSAITINKPGKYSVAISSGNCTNSDEIEVNYYLPIFTLLGDEYAICDKDKELIKLDAGEGFVHYKWTPTQDTTQWITVSKVGQYFVLVKDYRGCVGDDGTKVENRCPVSVYFPNCFTPNDDGINDWFEPKGSDVIDFNLKIANRWGQIVFESNNISHTWDGTINGKPAAADNYVYFAEYSGYVNKKKQQFYANGNLTLLR